VRVSGKLRGQRAKSMKYVDGYMIKSGDPKQVLVDRAVRHLILEQGAFLPSFLPFFLHFFLLFFLPSFLSSFLSL
jgi:hypothetical protein